MSIDRCVCFDAKFSTLKAYSDDHSANLDALRARFGCGRGCALCLPYINAMLKTGQVEFPTDAPPPRD